MNRTVAVIQARTGSHRLPNKVLATLYDDVSILAHQCRMLRHMAGVDELVIATTDHPSDDAIVRLGEAEGIRTLRGSEDDVLSRFVQVAERTLAGTIVRITSDSPFRDRSVIEACVAAHTAAHAEYTRPRPEHLPKGMRAEVVETRVLQALDADPATSRRDREHVTLHIREHPDQYRLEWVDFPKAWHRPDFDLSVDTPEDLAFVRSVCQTLRERGETLEIGPICSLLEEMTVMGGLIKDLAR